MTRGRCVLDSAGLRAVVHGSAHGQGFEGDLVAHFEDYRGLVQGYSELSRAGE